MSLQGVGIDVADIRRFARLLGMRGSAFAARWFTEAEIAQCMATATPATAFAMRYAAKEAVWKALGPGEWTGPLPWRGISVLEEPSGTLVVTLDGPAAELAALAEVTVVRVATVPGPRMAIATAVAEGRATRRP
ncbi:phosphopantetheine--protein transferase-like protein [Nocardioides luteus]|uniref:Holo-[acyl-carrier-protein] synthase n=1 Tax=Nocardioides luteus TaxID=1844 RepID=A0ABQ5SXI4_9ACTN|nr:4'-phosphopantetheinyl transferase superfamily protein [Nocardioides luteus]MDR7309231.1 phosphopantetheine--protein transferase-like protein [Nocardioides luteus]GGR48915.1 holo-[acyl-carrier-protein] synthase [Nocardioides luteus]GLJ67636.1 holo-[acyl-carrier-protein] synthase [Nocardioides luteus]